jgi:hypothetical protein
MLNVRHTDSYDYVLIFMSFSYRLDDKGVQVHGFQSHGFVYFIPL